MKFDILPDIEDHINDENYAPVDFFGFTPGLDKFKTLRDKSGRLILEVLINYQSPAFVVLHNGINSIPQTNYDSARHIDEIKFRALGDFFPNEIIFEGIFIGYDSRPHLHYKIGFSVRNIRYSDFESESSEYCIDLLASPIFPIIEEPYGNINLCIKRHKEEIKKIDKLSLDKQGASSFRKFYFSLKFNNQPITLFVGSLLAWQNEKFGQNLKQPPSYLLFIGKTTHEFREKVRFILSFLSDQYCPYLGSISINNSLEITAFNLVSPYGMHLLNKNHNSVIKLGDSKSSDNLVCYNFNHEHIEKIIQKMLDNWEEKNLKSNLSLYFETSAGRNINITHYFSIIDYYRNSYSEKPRTNDQQEKPTAKSLRQNYFKDMELEIDNYFEGIVQIRNEIAHGRYSLNNDAIYSTYFNIAKTYCVRIILAESGAQELAQYYFTSHKQISEKHRFINAEYSHPLSISEDIPKDAISDDLEWKMLKKAKSPIQN